MEEGCHDCMAMSSTKTNLQEIIAWQGNQYIEESPELYCSDGRCVVCGHKLKPSIYLLCLVQYMTTSSFLVLCIALLAFMVIQQEEFG